MSYQKIDINCTPTPTPTLTPTPEPSWTPTPTPELTIMATPSATPTQDPEPTLTPTPTYTPLVSEPSVGDNTTVTCDPNVGNCNPKVVTASVQVNASPTPTPLVAGVVLPNTNGLGAASLLIPASGIIMVAVALYMKWKQGAFSKLLAKFGRG